VRRVDAASLAALVPLLALLPVTLVALAPFWLAVSGLVSFRGFAGGYLAVGGLLFVKPVQRVMLSTLFHLRPPTADEHARLDPAWWAVLDRAGIPRDRYVLAVEERPELNAMAAGSHVVAATTKALYSVPQRELEAVLAHELGHHRGLHAVGFVAVYWLGTPIVLLARVAYALQNLGRRLGWFAAMFGLWPALLIAVVLGWVIRLLAWLFLLTVRIADGLCRLIGRQSEFIADRAAIEMGYGPQLEDALQRFIQQGEPRSHPLDVGHRLLSSHPPLQTRLRRVRAANARQVTATWVP
jgi:Zn-dependent protease with chaperone function